MTPDPFFFIAVVLAISLGFGATSLAMEQGKSSTRLAIEVSLQIPDDSHVYLHMRITNTSKEPLSFSEFVVPWLEENSLVLIAAADGGAELKKVLSFSHSSGGPIILIPGKFIEGRIALHDRFVGLHKVRKDNYINLFWSYQMRLHGGQYLEPQGGWLLIPRAG